jgi:hypothetical protein
VKCDQLKPERLDLGEHSVQGGLVGQFSGQDGVAVLRDSRQGWEGAEGSDRLNGVRAAGRSGGGLAEASQRAAPVQQEYWREAPCRCRF